eukprot:CAMPEP_0178898490 /NCGR_PEP_ID=MMETSP0786-20121207/2361_1 /TAXON_ID=186022 /ORGANISM="Thalassionema frauenfeldii, Strain CCMP 1798" /LENGTH=564 /DNA_ID=CAMNT_0020569217 /DNA_START=323 /DNA_END=2017 /DNA_ORIENTATION=-
MGLLYEFSKSHGKDHAVLPDHRREKRSYFEDHPMDKKNSLRSHQIDERSLHKHPEAVEKSKNDDDGNNAEEEESEVDTSNLEIMAEGGLPVLPIFTPVPDGEALIESTMDGSNPTMPGVIALMQKYLKELDAANKRLRDSRNFDAQKVTETFFDVSFKYLKPFDDAYRGRSIFPIREDESIFLSLAAYREHLLADTLTYAFTQAKDPDNLFVGAVVQNCFGKVLEDGTIDPSGKPCKTGLEVVGKNSAGKDMTKMSDAPPDHNGIADFCAKPSFRKYCESGQVRVLYVNASESLGPAMARYYASKLWGGETYFIQCDSHLQFATHWDDKYIQEVKATSNYPKSVLSSYPPGFTGHDPNFKGVRETPGARLCTCETKKDEPNAIVRINTGSGYRGTEPRPTQIPYIAAGFFFARSEFLIDVPFDPYLPWCFMGEEIALSMRAWTRGWNIYAPRKNLIAHQYRPGRMGLPKFWESVDQFWGRPGIIYRAQAKVLKRIKHMVGYPDAKRESIEKEGIEVVLTEIEEYGIGKERSWNEFLEFASMEIDEANKRVICRINKWCNQGLKD